MITSRLLSILNSEYNSLAIHIHTHPHTHIRHGVIAYRLDTGGEKGGGGFKHYPIPGERKRERESESALAD